MTAPSGSFSGRMVWRMNTDRHSIAIVVIAVLLVFFPLAEAQKQINEKDFQEKLEGTVWTCGWYTVRFGDSFLEVNHGIKVLRKTRYRIRETSAGVLILPEKDWFIDGFEVCEFELMRFQNKLILARKKETDKTGYFVLGKERT